MPLVERIKANVLKKAGMKKPRIFSLRKFASFAAAVVIISGVLIYANHDWISADVSNLFSFIPGFGITDSGDGNTYALSSQVSAESNGYTLTITNASADSNSLYISFYVTHDGETDSTIETPQQFLKDEALAENILKADADINIIVDSKSYSLPCMTVGDCFPMNYNGNLDFKELKITDLNITDKTKLSLEYRGDKSPCNFSCDFSLKPASNFDSLKQIGSTQEHNNFTLTATSSEKDGQLHVAVYPINKTGYTLVSVGKCERYPVLFNKDVSLQTDKGNKAYSLPDDYQFTENFNWNTGFYTGPFNFNFDVSDGSKNYVLKVPYVIVQSDESQNVNVPIPAEGKTEQVNIPIKFKDGTALITSVENTEGYAYMCGRELKISVQYQNEHENQQLVNMNLYHFISSLDISQSASIPDKDGKYSTFIYPLSKNETNTLQLTASNPQYAFTDEYDLALGK